MKEHPHAEVLRAIADGVPLSEFEVWRITWERGEWKPGSEFTLWMFEPLKWQIRRKPQHIMVNGAKFYVGADGLAEATAFITRLFIDAGYGQGT